MLRAIMSDVHGVSTPSPLGDRQSPRICSLLPGATEVVAALGMADHLVGISHECDFPPDVHDKPVLVHPLVPSEGPSGEIDRHVSARVAEGQSLYALDEARFRAASPDVIITQELCQVCAVTPSHLERAVQTLPSTPTVVTLNPVSLDQVLGDVATIGRAIGRESEARDYLAELQEQVRDLQAQLASATTRPRVACLEWLDPLYCAGHWVPELVALAGATDLLGRAGEPSRRIDWSELQDARPEVLVLMPCGFSVDRTVQEALHQRARHAWPALPAVAQQQVYAVEAAAYFSRPGPRLVEGARLLAALFHPEVCGGPPSRGARRVDLSGTIEQ